MYINFIFRQSNKNKEILLRLRVWFGCYGDRGAADWVFPGAGNSSTDTVQRNN